MDIDLGQEYSINVKYNGQEYKLREPNLYETKQYQKEVEKIKDDSDALFDKIVDFLSSLGLPKEVTKQLSVKKLNLLIDGILSEPEKKS